MVKILIVDDHAVLRAGFKHIITPEMGRVDVGEASNGEEAMRLIEEKKWDAVVLGISMSDRTGTDLLSDIKTVCPELPILVLSVHGEDQFALRVLKAGASGYLSKAATPSEVVEAIRKVLEGGRYISPSLAEQFVGYLVKDSKRPPHERLSDRELEIMCLIASGKSREQIAEQLKLSVKTVSTYRARVLEKTQFSGNAEMTRYALKHNLVS